MKGNSKCSHVCLSPLGPKKIIDSQRQGCVVLFPPLVVLEHNAKVFGKNVDKAKVEVRTRMEDFLVKAFEKFYIAIWSCMKFEDVLEVFPMLMPKNFVDWFVFIYECEQCSKTIGQISLKSHYYLKDLKRVYYGYRGMPYGKEDQTLFIDDEPNKVLWNSKWTNIFL
jgi:hypothetical protein